MKPTAAEILWYLAMANPPGEGSNNYVALNNKPKFEGTTLVGALTAVALKILRLEVVQSLPAFGDRIGNTLYIVKDETAVPPVGPLFYIWTADQEMVQIEAGSDYTPLENKPEIDEHVLEPENNTHESLELLSELDIVAEKTPEKNDGIEIVYGPGSPSAPAEITEINDDEGVKYATNFTSSNYYINSQFDELFRIVSSVVTIKFASVLPDPPERNSIYYIDTETPHVFHVWLVDSIGTVKDGGELGFDTSGFVKDTRRIANIQLNNDIGWESLWNAMQISMEVANYPELKFKKVDAENNNIVNLGLGNFKPGVVETAMPTNPTHDQILTAKAIENKIETKFGGGGVYVPNIWEGMLRGGQTLTGEDFSGYSRLFIHAQVWSYNMVAEVDLDHLCRFSQYPGDFPSDMADQLGYIGLASALTFETIYDDTRGIALWFNAYVNSAKNKIFFKCGQYILGQNRFRPVNDDAGIPIYKMFAIDGIKKG